MEIKTALSVLAALSQVNRLEIFRLLVQAGPQGLSPGAIAERLGLAGATLSFHLKELKNAGAVHSERDGRSLVYRADFSTMNALVGFLLENCCGGDGTSEGESSSCCP